MSRITIACVLLLAFATFAEGQTKSIPPCPGYNPANNTNLACQFATGFPSAQNFSASNTATGTNSGFNPAVLSTALAAQLSALPVATAVSGTGITFINGIPTLSSESLGTILTQRGETIGKHRFFFSFNYQRFQFGQVDQTRLKSFTTVGVVQFPNVGTSFVASQDRIDFKLDQYTALATFGITDRIDLTLVVPFSTVKLSTQSGGTQYNVTCSTCTPSNSLVSQFPTQTIFLTGQKTGPGDIIISMKGNLVRAENGISVAVGTDLRLPTGDEQNYLGTGAYGVKPYLIVSHRGKRLTPNINVGYQWNSASALYTDQTTGAELNLPAALLYSGGADFKVNKRLTLVGEFIGQYVLNGPTLTQTTVNVPGVGNFVSSQGAAGTSNYAIDNAGGGFKLRIWQNLLVNGSLLTQLDHNSLRAKLIPLVGVSYRF